MASGGNLVLTDAKGYWTAQAAMRLGVAGKDLLGFFNDMDEGSSLRQSNSGTTSGPASVVADGSWWTCTAGNGTVAGSNLMLMAQLPGSVTATHVANLRTSKWFLVLRMKVTTTPSTNALIGLRSSSGSLRCGIAPGSSATKFVISQGGLVSTVSFDTNTHEIAVWNDGTNTSLSVDAESPQSQLSSILGTAGVEFGFECTAAVSEAAQTYQVDYFGMWTART